MKVKNLCSITFIALTMIIGCSEDNLPWTYNEEQLYVEDQLLNIDKN
jgi:hypothetical protein